VAGSLAWNLAQHDDEVRSLTFQAARALLEKDLLYREWSILHGGVYVPKSASAEPSTAAREEEQEIVTTSGQTLTLLNPAVVSRQVLELQERQTGIRGHLTSLKPVRAANRPDDWERQALEDFEKGRKEVSSVETFQGERCFRMMRPLVTVPACLRCHEEAGRKPGEIRGGINQCDGADEPICEPRNKPATRDGPLGLVALRNDGADLRRARCATSHPGAAAGGSGARAADCGVAGRLGQRENAPGVDPDMRLVQEDPG
jgi:hypothetical protein